MSTPHVRTIELTAGDLTFEIDVAGPTGAPLVLLLHGFPQTSHTFRNELTALAEAGYRAAAPNQRGYSPRARPPDVASYASELLVNDVLAIGEALVGSARFHLVGHDWGGQIAWLLAARHPERLCSLSVLSRPHPAAFARALQEDPAQAARSGHHQRFQDPSSAARMLENDAARLRGALADQGVPARDVDAYLARLGDEATLDAALNWYRARAGADSALALPNVPAVDVPTLYVWGDADAAVGRTAAEATREYVRGPFTYVVLEGVGHFLTDQAGERVTDALLAHIVRHADTVVT